MFLLFCNWIICLTPLPRGAVCKRHVQTITSLPHSLNSLFCHREFCLINFQSLLLTPNTSSSTMNLESGEEMLQEKESLTSCAHEKASSSCRRVCGIASSHSLIFSNDLRIFTFHWSCCFALAFHVVMLLSPDEAQRASHIEIYEQSHWNFVGCLPLQLRKRGALMRG